METTGHELTWRVEGKEAYTIALFEIARPDGILDYRSLSHIRLPDDVAGREDRGLIISGRGPVWLYAYLTHLAHAFAWLGIYEPRHQGAVVVERHTRVAPAVGEIVPCELPVDRSGLSKRETTQESEGKAK